MTVEHISPAAALALIEQGASLSDIRDADEYAREHIPAARLLPLAALEQGATLQAGADDVVIFHCQSGNRTRNHLSKLIAAAAPAQAPTALSSARAGLVAQTGRQCPQRLSELVDEIQLAIQAGDVNRLSALYWWAGQDNDRASRLLERLEATAARPLVDIAPVYPEPATASEAATPQWREAGSDGGNEAAAPVVVTAPRPPRPYALRIEQVLTNRATPARSILYLRHQYGCFWINF